MEVGAMYNNYTKIIRDSLVEDMNEKIKVYNSQLSKLQNEQSIPELYEMIVNIYGNGPKQACAAEAFLREVLTHDFFKKSEIINLSNEIRFTDGEYYISFPKSRLKVIDIVAINIGDKPYFFSTNLNKKENLVHLVEEFLSKKTLSNLKKLNLFYRNNETHTNPIKKIYSYYDTYKTFNVDKLTELEDFIYNEKIKKKRYELELEEYQKDLNNSLEFANSLEDLKIWKEAGWAISFSLGEYKRDYKIIN